MAEDFRIVERWPDLFEGVSARTTESVIQVLASSYLDGWIPNRTDVADLVDFVTGRIDLDEYERRSAELVERPKPGD